MLVTFNFHDVINFDHFTQLLPLVSSSIAAGMILGFMAGIISPLIHARDLAFAVHGTSELSFAGAAAALYFGQSVTSGAIIGSLIAAAILGLLGSQAKNRNTSIGILLPFGIGIGVLFLGLYKGRSSNKFGLLAGQIVSVDNSQLKQLAIVSLIVLVTLAIIWRPLYFATVDPEVAAARGVNLRLLSVIFMILLGLTTAMAVQLVGALLVLSLLITPACSAAQITANPVCMSLLSIIFAVTAAIGGILLSLGPGLPISPYVTTVSFIIYLSCYLAGKIRQSHAWGRRKENS